MATLTDFIDDAPWVEEQPVLQDYTISSQIAGVRLQRLVRHQDSRGGLTVLLSDLYGFDGPPPPHVYLVEAVGHSVRAWVYHKRQSDRLAYTNGDIRVVLYDLRPGSATEGKLNVIDVGAANPTLLTIPPFVIHGVQNRGDTAATFINMPTRAYDPQHPDKSRLPKNHPGVPYQFG